MTHTSPIRFWWPFQWSVTLMLFASLPGDLVFAQASKTVSTKIDSASARLPRRLMAVRTTGPIVVDGRLNEPDWERAPLASDFTQSTPFEGQPSSERTEVRVLYDDSTLYVGVMAYQTHVSDMVVKQLKRDFDGKVTDWVAIILDTFHDRRNGYQFASNPAGAAYDSQKSNEGRDRNLSWDGIWFVRTQVGPEGWSAEFAVPFRTLQFSNTSPQTWGINFERHLQRKQEDSYWAPVPRQYLIDRLSLAGTLEGLEGIRPGANVRVKPLRVGRPVA